MKHFLGEILSVGFFGYFGAFIRWVFFLGKKKYFKLLYGEDTGSVRLPDDVNKWVGMGFFLLLALLTI